MTTVSTKAAGDRISSADINAILGKTQNATDELNPLTLASVVFATGYTSTRIQNALNLMPSTGGTVFLRTGSYSVGTTITLSGPRKLMGAGYGTILQPASDIRVLTISSSYSHVRDLAILRANADTAAAVYFDPTTTTEFCRLSNLKIYSSAQGSWTGIHVNADTGSFFFNEILNTDIISPKYGYVFDATPGAGHINGNKIIGGSVVGFSPTAIRLKAAQNNSLQWNVFRDIELDYQGATGGSAIYGTDSGSDIGRLSGNRFDHINIWNDGSGTFYAYDLPKYSRWNRITGGHVEGLISDLGPNVFKTDFSETALSPRTIDNEFPLIQSANRKEIPTIGWSTTSSGSGSASLQPLFLQMETGVTANSFSKATTLAAGLSGIKAPSAWGKIDWNRKLYFSFTCDVLGQNSGFRGRIHLREDFAASDIITRGFGIRVSSLSIQGDSYGITGARGANTIGTFTGLSNPQNFLIVFTPNAKLDWYINGTLKRSTSGTTNFPAWQSPVRDYIVVSVNNGGGGGTTVQFPVSNIRFWQEAPQDWNSSTAPVG